MTLSADVVGNEVRIYFDGNLIGVAEHEPAPFEGASHELVGRGVVVLGIGKTPSAGFHFTNRTMVSRFPSSMAREYQAGDPALKK